MGWMLFFMLVILKIPLAAAIYIIWYAIKEEPQPDEEPAGEDRGPRPQAAAEAALAAARPRGRRRRLQAASVPAGDPGDARSAPLRHTRGAPSKPAGSRPAPSLDCGPGTYLLQHGALVQVNAYLALHPL